MVGWGCSATRPVARSSSCSPAARRSVQELADQLPISRPAVSQHLRSPQGRRPGRQPGRGHPPDLPAQPGRRRRAARMARRRLGRRPRRVPEGGRDRRPPRPRRRPEPGGLMTTTAPIPPITGDRHRRGCPSTRRSRVFTGTFTAWWPHQYHIGQAEVAEVILEPQRGRPLVRARGRRQRVRLGPGAGLGAPAPGGVHLADQRRVAVRPRPRPRQRDRGAVRRGRTRSRPRSRSNTATSNGSSAARPSTTPSAAAAAGRCCWTGYAKTAANAR